MSTYTVKIDLLPGYGYSSSTLYKYADTKLELSAIVLNAKQNSAAYRISVNDKPVYESKGSGAKKRWYRK